MVIVKSVIVHSNNTYSKKLLKVFLNPTLARPRKLIFRNLIDFLHSTNFLTRAGESTVKSKIPLDLPLTFLKNEEDLLY